MQKEGEAHESTHQDKKLPEIDWDIGTAYDFFISLNVLHRPEIFGLRPSWAAGVRSRMPTVERKFLEEIQPILQYPIHWVYSLQGTKDVTSALWALRQIPADQLMRAFHVSVDEESESEKVYNKVFNEVQQRRQWTEADLKVLKDNARKYDEKPSTKELQTILTWWSKTDEFGEQLLPALQSYYQNFFAEEEKRIASILQDALQRTKEMTEKLPLVELLEELSQGVHFEFLNKEKKVVLIPVYWSTPLIIQGRADPKTRLICYGVRPRGESLVPGDQVPDDLIRVLKALADPTRLKIMRYLAAEPASPADMARRLRLRAPTVIHHLNELRLAGLVHVMILEGGEKRYTPRLDAISTTYASFLEFVNSGSES
jgi:DNA-binding transcriptional ArsR family regulator